MAKVFEGKKLKLRFTVGGKISLAIAITMLIVALTSFLLMRVILYIHIVSDEIEDLTSICETSSHYLDQDQSLELCDIVKRVYDSNYDDQLKGDSYKEYLALFPDDEEIKKEGIDLDSMREKLEILPRNFKDVKDAGLCIWDRDNKKLVIVESIMGTPRGTTEAFDGEKYDSENSDVPCFFHVEGKFFDRKERTYSIKAVVALSENKGDESKFVYVVEKSEGAYSMMVGYTIIYLALILFLVVIIHTVIGRILKGIIVWPLNKLSRAARQYSASPDKLGSERYFENVNIRTHDEVRDLSDAMKEMERQISQYMENLTKVTEEKQKLATELEIAARIQANMLPERLELSDKSYGIFPFMRPARLVGGDFYDFFEVADNRVALVIADVSDKGVPAALFMVVSRLLIKGSLGNCGGNVALALKEANALICENNKDMMFVTVFAGIYDISDGSFTYVNAGHEDPVIYRSSEKRYSYIMEEHDIFMGIDEDIDFIQRKITLEQGDKLFLYTDGVTEAADKQDNRYGTDRLLDTLNADVSLTGDDVINAMWKSISDFQDIENQADDVTMLLFET